MLEDCETDLVSFSSPSRTVSYFMPDRSIIISLTIYNNNKTCLFRGAFTLLSGVLMAFRLTIVACPRFTVYYQPRYRKPERVRAHPWIVRFVMVRDVQL